MVALAFVHNVEGGVGFEVGGAVEDGGEVGGGVVGGAVGLADDEGVGAFGGAGVARVFFVKDDQGALAFLGDAACEQFGVNGGHLVVVKAFAEGLVEADAELVVDFLEGGDGDLADVTPDGGVFGVAGLEFYEFGAGGVEHGRVGVGGGVTDFVKAFEFFERSGGEGGVEGGAIGGEGLFVSPDDFAEGGAPVADVVVADDAGSAEGCDPGHGLADDGGAQVADVHLFGGVGRGVVYHPSLSGEGAGGGGAQGFGGGEGGQPGFEGGGLEGEV